MGQGSSIEQPVGLNGERPVMEPDEAEMKRLIDGASARVIKYLAGLPAEKPLAKVSYPDTDFSASCDLVAGLVEDTLPESATPYDTLLDTLFDDCLSAGINTAHPGYLAHIGGGGIYPAAVADYITLAVNRQMAVWQCCPGFVRLEMNVLRWFCNLAGLNAKTSLGSLTTGGSTATLSAIVAARTAKLPEEFTKGCLYTSAQAHHCVGKAAVIAGFPARRVRHVPVDECMRMKVDALKEMVEADRQSGLLPFMVVPTFGTTNTGAIDDLTAVADFCEKAGLWMHTDAAYGFFYLLSEVGKTASKGIERSDSICLDPHKGLGLPYGTGCLLVRDYAQLMYAHDGGERGAYMPTAGAADADGVATLVDFTAGSPELSREFRGLRIWLPMKLWGAQAFRDNIEENVANARWVAEELRSINGIEIVTEPQLSVLSFRLVQNGRSADQLNQDNKALLQAINGAEHVFISPTDLDGKFVLRVALSSFRSHRAGLVALVADVRQAATTVIASSGSVTTTVTSTTVGRGRGLSSDGDLCHA